MKNNLYLKLSKSYYDNLRHLKLHKRSDYYHRYSFRKGNCWTWPITFSRQQKRTLISRGNSRKRGVIWAGIYNVCIYTLYIPANIVLYKSISLYNKKQDILLHSVEAMLDNCVLSL